ncbi:MAG: hypothetical protein RLT05_10070 [Bauldia litoralis]
MAIDDSDAAARSLFGWLLTEGMTRELGRSLLVSAPFAALHGGAFDNLGDFALKGMAERRTLYGPAA